jgi:CRP-like cAMP-binding protein
MESLQQILAEYPFFKGLEPSYLQFVAECAAEVRFDPGQYMLCEGKEGSHFYLIRQGMVALGTFTTGHGFATIQTLGEGEIVGWSWLIPPYYWHFSGLVIRPTLAIALDTRRLRERCETDHNFGYEILKRLATVVGQRLRAARTLLSAQGR